MVYIKREACKTSNCKGRILCCQTRLLFIMRDSFSEMPTKVHISLFSSFCSRHHYRIETPWKIRSINHYTTLNSAAFLCCAFRETSRFRSFGILFKWQTFVYRLIMTTQTDCLPMKSCMIWLECYCVTHLIFLYLIIRYIN